MEKLFYTIGEVADEIGESVSLVRFWSNSFPRLIKPHRNAKGNRLYTAADLETMRQMHYLVKEKGLTLEGAGKQMIAERAAVEARVKVLSSLKALRSQLSDIKKDLL